MNNSGPGGYGETHGSRYRIGLPAREKSENFVKSQIETWVGLLMLRFLSRKDNRTVNSGTGITSVYPPKFNDLQGGGIPEKANRKVFLQTIPLADQNTKFVVTRVDYVLRDSISIPITITMRPRP